MIPRVRWRPSPAWASRARAKRGVDPLSDRLARPLLRRRGPPLAATEGRAGGQRTGDLLALPSEDFRPGEVVVPLGLGQRLGEIGSASA